MPASNFTLYAYWRSSCSWRLRWALNIKGISYQTVPVNLALQEQASPAYLAINPLGVVPSLKVSEDLILSDSIAILEWLEERFPSPPLLPTSPDQRWQCRRIVQHIASGIFPLQNLKVQKYVSGDLNVRTNWARHWIEQGFASLEKTLQQTAGTFCVGSQLTQADLCLVPQVYNARRFGVDLSPYSTIRRIDERCHKEPTCLAAAPDNQPDKPGQP